MLSEPIRLTLLFIAGAGILLGVSALFTLSIPSRISRVLGMVSIGCVFAPMLIAIGIVRRLPAEGAWFYLCLFSIPGALGIIFNGVRHDKPGHCKTCGYNLTGNVSGKCSECGAPVPAP